MMLPGSPYIQTTLLNQVREQIVQICNDQELKRNHEGGLWCCYISLFSSNIKMVVTGLVMFYDIYFEIFTLTSDLKIFHQANA